MVSSTATPPSSLPAVFPTCSRSFSISGHSQAPIAATSVSPMSNCLPPASHYPVPPSHQNSRVSLLPPHIAQQSYTVHGSPQLHYPVPPSHQNSPFSLLPPHIAQQSYTVHGSPQSHYPVPPSHQNSPFSLLPPHIAQQSYTVHGSPRSHYPVPPSHQNSPFSLLPPHIAQQSYTVHGSPRSHYPVPPSHQNSRVSLLPPHIAQQSYTVHGSPQLHYPSSTPLLPGIFSISPTTCLSQVSFFLSQSFSTVYPNAPISQGYPKSQFPFSQHLSYSVDIPPHPTTSCLPNSVHVDTSVPPPSFPPAQNMDFRVPMLHKMTNSTNPHCKLSELVASNISINVSSSSSSGSTIEPHSSSQISSSDSQIPAATCLESCTIETSSPQQLSSVVIHGDKVDWLALHLKFGSVYI